MEAQAWTAIGLLAATLIGSLYFMVQRMDALAQRIDGTNSRVDDLGGHLDGTNSRIDALGGLLETRIDELAREMRGLGARFSPIEVRLASFDERFEFIDERFDLVDQRLDLVDTRLAGLSLKLDDHLHRHWG